MRSITYKIVAASSDGKVVNQRFGRSTQLLIFEAFENAINKLITHDCKCCRRCECA